MSDAAPRLIQAKGRCICGVTDPTFEVSDIVSTLLSATCCGAMYLDRGKFISLVYGLAGVARREESTNPEGGADDL